MPPIPATIPQNLDATIGTANMVGILLSTITYGIHFTLFIILVRSPIVVNSRRLPKPHWRLMAYATVLFLLATIGLCLQTWLNHSAFILHRDCPGGPLAYLVETAHEPGNLATTAVYVVLNWFADGMLLYRFIHIFGRSKFAFLVSAAMIISLIVVGSLFLPNISTLSVNLWTNTSNAPSLTYLALSLSINATLTLAIICRLLWWHRQTRLLPGSNIYTSVIAMFVESASLYTIIAFVCVVTCSINSPVKNALLPMLGQLQALPPLLITIRAMERRVTEQTILTTKSTISFLPAGCFSSTYSKASADYSKAPPSYPQPCLSRSSTIMHEKQPFDYNSAIRPCSPLQATVANALNEPVIRDWGQEEITVQEYPFIGRTLLPTS